MGQERRSQTSYYEMHLPSPLKCTDTNLFSVSILVNLHQGKPIKTTQNTLNLLTVANRNNDTKPDKKRCFMCHVSHVICHMSHIAFYMLHVACHLSPVTCHLSLTPTATALPMHLIMRIMAKDQKSLEVCQY